MSQARNESGSDINITCSRRRLIISLLVLLISTTFCLSPTMAGDLRNDDHDAQRLVFRVAPRGIELVSVDRVPSRRSPDGQGSGASLELAVIDKAGGRTVCTRPLADPFLVYADTVVGGSLAGGPARLDDQFYSVVVPAVGPGQRIEISRPGRSGLKLADFDGLIVERVEKQDRERRETDTGAPAEIVYYSGDPANRLDILMLGDGYTADEMVLFDEHVTAAVDGLLASEPFDRFAGFINIHKLEVVSSESGTDEPDQVPPVYVDTAFNSSFNYAGVPQLLYAQTDLVLESAAAVPEYDTIILLVNTSRYGGGAGSYAAFAGGASSAVKLMLHEFGHSFGGLTDEYESPYDTYSGPEPAAPNCTTMSWFMMNAQELKWYRWLGIDGVGVNEGCEYYAHGKYRPSESCLMRSLDADFDPVCREVMALRLFDYAGPVDDRDPETDQVQLADVDQSFLVQGVDDGMISVEWYFDGEPLASGNGTQCRLSPAEVAPGEHLLEAVVALQDAWLLEDTDGRLTERVSWVVVRDAEVQAFAVSLQVQAEVTAGDRLWVQLAIGNVSAERQSFQASLDLVRCDGTRVNGFRRGSGSIQPGDERFVNLPIRIPSQVPEQLLECPLTLELVVNGGAGSGEPVSDSGSFTIHAG